MLSAWVIGSILSFSRSSRPAGMGAAAEVILRRSDWRLAYNVLLINALTNPPAMAAAREFGVNFWLVEGWVCAVEVPLYRLLLRGLLAARFYHRAGGERAF